MLEIYFGSDIVSARAKAFKVASDSTNQLIRIETETFFPHQIASAVQSVSLFGDRQTYLIDTPSGNEVMNTEALAVAKEMKEASDLFIIIEGPLLAPAKKQWSKVADTIEEFTRQPLARFNVFKLAEALLVKDKKSLWLLLTEATRAGLASEEIIGTLWWQLKTLRLARLTDSAESAGLKDFTYDKAKRALKNFKPGEIEQLSSSLLAVYHDGHGGVREIDLALEEWVLRL